LKILFTASYKQPAPTVRQRSIHDDGFDIVIIESPFTIHHSPFTTHHYKKNPVAIALGSDLLHPRRPRSSAA
jgi:hypothetical protein